MSQSPMIVSGPKMLPGDSELRWYLVHCKANEDRRAHENLERQGFECFFPVRAVERHRKGRKVVCTEPLFPKYLFIRLNSVNDNWSSVRSTRGVLRIVRFAAYPTPVPNEIVDGIREQLKGTSSPEPYLRPGERVCVTEGAFAQIEAIFIAADGDERVVLLLNLLQRDQEMSFPIRSVRKLG